ncbi:prepilin-type N-terminal cleavage/methylation domain-containing protein [Bacillus sp. X1(2014)]|uniref:prepilin-type N-terminal cleavage/methylation domain-containing protein n=1 Tax=Bacillus sp. X1(2014) TaxID=1565991 RepID=UPI0011A74FE2|nr:prepilin-type N-terminal cleavage/methylation domain-containing protein [Bacillus sp. X1(2014)]
MTKYNKGVTLIELLAVLSLLSIVILLVASVQLFGQNQSRNQKIEIQSQSDIRLALNMITKDIRSAKSGPENVIVTIPNTEFQIKTENNTTIVYKFDGNKTLLKDSQPLVANIKEFILDKNAEKISLTLTSNDAGPISLSTTIYFRK